MPAEHDDFAEFYAASYGRVVAVVAAIVGERHQAEDIAQEAFSRALTRWPRIASYDQPEAWVRRVALRLTIDASRRMRRAASLSMRLAAGQRGSPGLHDPGDPLAATALSVALIRLPLAHWQVLVLYASMLAYTLPNGGFETVSLAAGTGRSWTASHAGAVGAYSLSWAGDRTLAFEWAPAENPYPAGIGIRLLNVTAAGTLLGASRLAVPYRRYCAGGGWGCLGDPVLTPDGSKVMVAKGTREGSVYTDSVVEYSTQTGQALASVAPPVSSQFPGTLCVPLWTDPSGSQVVTLCGHPEKYDHGRVTPITLHQPMYGTDVMPFGWQPGSPGS